MLSTDAEGGNELGVAGVTRLHEHDTRATNVPEAAAAAPTAVARASRKTPRTVRGLGFIKVDCFPRDASATRPRSPDFLAAALTSAAVRPVAALTALMRMLSPIPSSRLA